MGFIDFGVPSTPGHSAEGKEGSEPLAKSDSEPLMEFTPNLSIPYSQWRALVIDIKSRGEEPPLVADQLLSLEELKLWPEKVE